MILSKFIRAKLICCLMSLPTFSQAITESLNDVNLNQKELNLAASFSEETNLNSFLISINKLFTSFIKHVQAAELIVKNAPCQNYLKAEIGISSVENLEFEEFTDEVVIVERQRCFNNPKNKSIQDILNILISDDFQIQAFENLTTSKTEPNGQRTCQETNVIGIGKSQYCFNNLIQTDQQHGIIFSVADQSSASATAPVYIRWSTILIKKLNTGHIQFYSLGYGRGPNIPIKFIAKKIILSQENKYSSILQNWIANE